MRRYFPKFPSFGRPAPDSPAVRKAKLLILHLLQLMEDVYIDLNLEDETQFEHPENAGWKALFIHWTGGQTFGEVRTEAGKTYGSAFQRFYQRLQEYRDKPIL